MITQLCTKYGHEYTDELMMKVLGGTEQRLSEILCKDLNLPISPKEFRDQLLELGDTMLAGTPLLDGRYIESMCVYCSLYLDSSYSWTL